MDIVAHALWATAGGRVLRERDAIDAATLRWLVVLAVAPDLVPMLPVVAYAAVTPHPIALLVGYATATPGTEPALPPLVAQLTHHLHCAMHSVVVLGALTGALWAARRRFPLVLTGWWLHVLVDVPTHSAEYYGVPLLYPFSERSFDGIAWTEPWMLVLNYALLAAAFAWLCRRRWLG